jgi:hypothetical protein
MINPTKLSYSLLGRLVSETLDLLLSLIRDLGSLEYNAGVLGLLEDLALGILGSLRGNTLDVLDQLLDVLAVLHEEGLGNGIIDCKSSLSLGCEEEEEEGKLDPEEVGDKSEDPPEEVVDQGEEAKDDPVGQPLLVVILVLRVDSLY